MIAELLPVTVQASRRPLIYENTPRIWTCIIHPNTRDVYTTCYFGLSVRQGGEAFRLERCNVNLPENVIQGSVPPGNTQFKSTRHLPARRVSRRVMITGIFFGCSII